MNESQRKWLTLYIGECWHEWYGGPMFGGTIPDDWPISDECKKCHTPRHFYAGHFGEMNRYTGHRTFTTWADLGAVKEAIEQKGEWASFQTFASGEYLKDDSGQFFFTLWLFNPSRFCELVCAWKGVE